MAMNEPSLRAMFQGMLVEPQKRDLDTELLNLRNSALVRLDKAVETLAAAKDKILTTQTLSDSGKSKALAQMAETSTPDFAWLGRMIAKAEAEHAKDLAQLLDPLTKRPADVNEVVQFLREQAIRKSFPPDGNEREVAYLKACETDAAETVRAILDAPGSAWISKDIRHRGQEAYMQRTAPVEFAKLKSLELLREQLVMLAGAISNWLVGMGADVKKVAATLGPHEAA